MKRLPPAVVLNLKVEFTRATDGRWIATVPSLTGVTVSARTRQQALAAIEALLLQIKTDRLAGNEDEGGL